MKSKLLSLLVALTMVTGSLAPSVPSYAQEISGSVTESSDETNAVELTDDEEDADVKELSAPSEVSAGDIYLPSDGEEAEEDAEYSEDEAETDEAESEESVDMDDSLTEDDITTLESEEDIALQSADSGEFKLRAVDLMFGESGDNKDGSLDKIFGIDSQMFKTEYKFVLLPEDYIEGGETGIAVPADEAEYDIIESAKLEEIPAGSKVVVYAKAVYKDETGEEITAFDSEAINIVKRKVEISFPQSERVCAYKPAEEEEPEAALVISSDDEIIGEIEIIPVTAYNFKGTDGEEYTVEGCFDYDEAAFNAGGIISGDIVLDISELTYGAEEFVSVPASFELSDDFAASFIYEDEALWPVMVYPYAEGEDAVAEEVEEENDLLGASDSYRFGFFIDNGQEKMSFRATSKCKSVYVTMTPKDDPGNETVLAEINSFNTAVPQDYQSINIWTNYYRDNQILTNFNKYHTGEYVITAKFYEDDYKTVIGKTISVDLIIDDLPSGYAVNVTPSTYDYKDDCVISVSGVSSYTDAKIKLGVSGNIAEKALVDGRTDFSKNDIASIKNGDHTLWFADKSDDIPTIYNILTDTFRRSLSTTVTVPVIYPVDGIRIRYAWDYKYDYEIEQGTVLSFAVGQTEQIACVIEPSEAYDTGYTLISDNPKVVSVDHLGNVKALKAGTANITAISVGTDRNGARVNKAFTIVVDPDIKLKSAKKMYFSEAPSEFTMDYSPGSDRYHNADHEIAVTVEPECEGSITWYIAEDGRGVAEFTYGDYEYTKPLDNGVCRTWITFNTPGKILLTARLSSEGYEDKMISCTITANGVANESQTPVGYFKNGVKLSGFMALDNSYKLLSTGDAALRELSFYDVYYAEPRNGEFVKDKVITVGKKKYYAQPSTGVIARGKNDLDTTIATDRCVNKLGELQTGIVKIDAKEYYYDPVTGLKAKYGDWVPYGKGMTLIKNGDDSIGAKGFLTDGSQYYYFDKNVLYKGLAYLDNSGELVPASKATCVAYFDPVTGANVTDNFEIKGKSYCVPESASDYSIIYTNDKYRGNDGKLHISDKGGAVIKKKFVTFENKTYYADENGCLLCNCTRVINGKTYCFLGDGQLYEYNDYIPQDFTVKADGVHHTMYLRSSKVGKPTDGVTVYYDNGTGIVPAKSCPIFDVADNLVYFTDKTGKLATGLVTYHGDSYWFDEKTAELATEKKIVSYKKKLYLCMENGKIANTKGFDSVDSGKFVYVKDTSGALATGIFTAENGKKYIIGDDGIFIIRNPKFGAALYKGKYYLTHYNYSDAQGNDIWTSPEGPAIAGSGPYFCIINKDGTVKKGWVTINKKKYYALGNGRLASGDNLRKIGGKIYAFNTEDDDPYVLTGWQIYYSVQMVDMDDLSNNSEFSGEPYYFYFDPKTGAAATGFKKMAAPKVNVDGSIAVDDYGSLIPGPVKNIFFNVDSNKIPVGALASNIALIYKGKKYDFDIVGAVKSGQEEMIDSDGFSQYRKKDGTIAVGRTLVKLSGGGTAYYFFNSYGNMETNVIRKTGSKWYYYGPTGQMMYSIDYVTFLHGETVYAIFNSDGSIKQFAQHVGNNIHVLKNCLILYGDKYDMSEWNAAVIGKNGLPVSGYSTVPIDNLGNLTVATDSDGKMVSDVTEPYLVKSGNKIYASHEGNVLRDTGTMYEIQSCALIPASDRDKLYALADMMKGGALKVIVNADGSLSSGTAVIGGRTYHKNKYGVPVELYSCFAKSGSNWYISYDMLEGTTPGVAGSLDLNVTNRSEGVYEGISIKYDANGKLISVTRQSDGSPVTGLLRFNIGGEYLTVGMKNGKPLTGKQTYKINGTSYKITLDEFGGNANFNNDI